MANSLVRGGAVENLIYEVRGRQVMLDSDLARLYQCKGGTKVVNQAARRNIERFPRDFYFQLTEAELLNLKSQTVTSSLRSQNGTANYGENEHGGVRKMPYVFTEQGVAMLATVLRTEVAAQMSVAIMRAFVAMRKYVSGNLLEQKHINDMVLEHDAEIKMLQKSFDKFEEKRRVNEIYFEGQIYDAYAKIQEIFRGAKRELIIVDAYADNTILDIVRRLEVEVMIIAGTNGLLSRQDVKRYNAQYHNLKVVRSSAFHDRYFILDEETVYHCGASVNRIGRKTFSINRIEDEGVKKLIIEKVLGIEYNKNKLIKEILGE